MVLNIIMAPLWSGYNDAVAKNDYDWMRAVYKRLIKLNVLVVAGVLVMILISPIVYRIWVGDSVSVPFMVSVFIGLYMTVLQGVIFIGSIVIIGGGLNLIGILIIMLITAIIPAVILPVQVKLLLNNQAKGIWTK